VGLVHAASSNGSSGRRRSCSPWRRRCRSCRSAGRSARRSSCRGLRRVARVVRSGARRVRGPPRRESARGVHAVVGTDDLERR